MLRIILPYCLKGWDIYWKYALSGLLGKSIIVWKGIKVLCPGWLAWGIEYSMRGFEKLSPDWPKEFNIFWRCEKFFCPCWLNEENIPWEGLKNSLLIGQKNLIFFEGVKKYSALAGWRNKIFLDRVWKTLSWLAERI